MSTSNDPKPLTRKELAQFLPSDRAIRAFERLFDIIPPDLNELNAFLDEIKIQPVNVSADYEISSGGNFIILVDATAAPVNITLPNTDLGFSTYNGTYFTIAIEKIDSSSNVVTVTPQLTQTIFNEASFDLLAQGEVINVIVEPSTTNWELAA